MQGLGLSRNPEFQKAMLRKRAQAIGTGQGYNTVDLTKAFASDMMQRRLQFQGIADQERRALKSIEQQDRMLNIDRKRMNIAKKKLRNDQRGLPWTIGIGLGTSLLSGLEGRRRRGVIAESTAKQQEFYDTIKNYLRYQKSSGPYRRIGRSK